MFHRRAPVAILILVLSLLPASAVQQQPAAKSADDFLKAVKQRFAPDTRLAVFDVTTAREGDALVLKGEVDDAAARAAALKAAHDAGHAQVVDRIVVLPDASVGPQQVGVVTVSVGHMRAQPRHAAELVNEVLMGAPVSVLKKQNGWYYVKAGTEKYLGWMEPDHVALMTPQELNAWNAAPKAVATTYFGLIRETAAPTALPVSDTVIGDVLKSHGTRAGRIEVELPDGRKGAIEATAAQDLTAWKTSRHLTPENIESTAKMFLGVSYLWGGTSAHGFDCSGFVKTVFYLNGLDLARDADQQGDQGQNVSIDRDLADLKKGDVLFFGPRPTGDRTQHISHVGLYLGNGEFIHCAGKVKRNSFDPKSPIYSENLLKRLVRVRRMASPTT
jgi:gamma-D-glutamyl-L-lysine dipeptidyl-peptidase